MSHDDLPDNHTVAWNIQVWAAFLAALGLTLLGIFQVPADLWVRGYLVMGMMFTVGSTFTLAKTVRDNQESRRLRNRVKKARAEQLLHEYEEAA